jgi:hypothetical protein
MSFKKMRLWWAVLVSAALIGAYWYWSPHMVLYEMAKATKNKDADALNEHVDYPKLRESIKGQLSAIRQRLWHEFRGR